MLLTVSRCSMDVAVPLSLQAVAEDMRAQALEQAERDARTIQV